MKPPKFPLRLHEDAEMLVSKKGEELIADPRHPVAFHINTLGLLQELIAKHEHNTRHMHVLCDLFIFVKPNEYLIHKTWASAYIVQNR